MVPDAVVSEAVAELDAVPALASPLRVTGLGGVAEIVLRSPGFAAAMAQARFEPVTVKADPDALMADDGWDMALIFSPYKQVVAERAGELTATAAQVGTVDTVVRGDGRTVGFNTNVWSVQQVLQGLVRGDVPARVLVLGSGPSARSAVAAARRAWGSEVHVAVIARRALAANAVPGAEIISGDAALAWEPTLLINCTTWGESAASEAASFELPFAELLYPGVLFLDLNNRVSALQTQALAAGATVASGIPVRDAGSGWRAAIARVGQGVGA